jgi:hypothetical protein
MHGFEPRGRQKMDVFENFLVGDKKRRNPFLGRGFRVFRPARALAIAVTSGNLLT